MKNLVFISILTLIQAISVSATAKTKFPPKKTKTAKIHSYDFPHLPEIGKTEAGDVISLGGFSGLAFAGKDEKSGELTFYTHTDRGPNAEPLDIDGDGVDERMFPLPQFQPELVKFIFSPSKGELIILARIPIRNQDGQSLSGLPNFPGGPKTALNDEAGVTPKGQRLTADPRGLDLEGIAVDSDGSFWMVEEYRPSFVHISREGVIEERFVPEGSNLKNLPEVKDLLPKALSSRKVNRGFEAIVIDGDKVLGFLQSPLEISGTKPKSTSVKRIRVIEFDKKLRKTTGQYLYEVGEKSDKISDATLRVPGILWLLERDDAIGERAVKRVYEVSLKGATNLNSMKGKDVLDTVPAADLKKRGIRLAKKRLVLDLAKAGYTKADKPEGLAYLDKNMLAVVNDDDFGLSGLYDPKTGTLTPNQRPQKSSLALIELGKPR